MLQHSIIILQICVKIIVQKTKRWSNMIVASAIMKIKTVIVRKIIISHILHLWKGYVNNTMYHYNRQIDLWTVIDNNNCYKNRNVKVLAN